MLTKTQYKIMEIFVSKITKMFNTKEICDEIKRPYPFVHRSIKDLVKKGPIIKNNSLLSLNYKANHHDLVYAEYLRKEDFLKKNKTTALFAKDFLDAIKIDYFTFLLFGSCVKNRQRKNSDVDVLVIIDRKEDMSIVERVIENVSSRFTIHFHCNVVSEESVYEMLSKRDEANIMNETLDNHIILFGAENFYRILKNAR